MAFSDPPLLGQKQRQRCKKCRFLDIRPWWDAVWATVPLVKICCISIAYPYIGHHKHSKHISFVVLYLTWTSHLHTTHLSSSHKSTSQSYATIYNILEYYKHPTHNVSPPEKRRNTMQTPPFWFWELVKSQLPSPTSPHCNIHFHVDFAANAHWYMSYHSAHPYSQAKCIHIPLQRDVQQTDGTEMHHSHRNKGDPPNFPLCTESKPDVIICPCIGGLYEWMCE